MATKTDPEKTADLPPHGSRNADPITDTPRSHPIETGVGAALGGAASGAAVGMVAGPVGAAIGAVAGAVAGGYAGKGVGELIDPTTQDNWLREYFGSDDAHTHRRAGDTADTYRSAYQYGVGASEKYEGKSYADVETHLKADWEKSHAQSTGLDWTRASGAVRDAYDRTIKLHEERLKVDKQAVKTGEVGVRKEVRTEHQTLTVPVEKEEIVIERRAVNAKTGAGDIKAEEIRIPVKEEKVNVSKETVLKEEVSVGKRKVTEDRTVEGDVRKEEIKVETEGDVKVRKTK